MHAMNHGLGSQIRWLQGTFSLRKGSCPGHPHSQLHMNAIWNTLRRCQQNLRFWTFVKFHTSDVLNPSNLSQDHEVKQ